MTATKAAGKTAPAAVTAAGAADCPDGADAFRFLASALLPVYAAIGPTIRASRRSSSRQAWPAGDVGAALGAAVRAFGPAVSLHVADLRRAAQTSRRPA